MKITPFRVGSIKSRSRSVRKLTITLDSSAYSDSDSETSCVHVGQRLRSCLKIRTQEESIGRIAGKSNAYTALSDHSLDVNSRSEQKVLRFANVEFREYALVLSDNPSTTSGPPIGIGWKYHPKNSILLDLDEYECSREGHRRTARELTLPPNVRYSMLREIGYSTKEIFDAMRSVGKVKVRRRVSIQRQKYEPVIEFVESVRTGINGSLIMPFK
jgi:hypothetical protein